MGNEFLLNKQYDLFNLGVQSLFSNQLNKTSYNVFDFLLGDADSNSTSSKNVEIENKKHIDTLRRNESYFIQLLFNADFEDGNTNQAIEYIDNQLKLNSIATSNWIAEFFSKYSTPEATDNENSINIIYGLLRIIAYLNNHDCFDYIKGTLTLILRLSLKINIPYLQEAGLMVIESWRSHDCLQILKEESFKDKYISKYADLLLQELIKELPSNTEVKDCLSV